MRRKKNRQPVHHVDRRAARLAELVAQFRAEGYSEQASRDAAGHQLRQEEQEAQKRMERERQEARDRQLAEWYTRGEMRTCPGDGFGYCKSQDLHAPENVIPRHEFWGALDHTETCPGSGAIVTEPAPMPENLAPYRQT